MKPSPVSNLLCVLGLADFLLFYFPTKFRSDLPLFLKNVGQNVLIKHIDDSIIKIFYLPLWHVKQLNIKLYGKKRNLSQRTIYTVV